MKKIKPAKFILLALILMSVISSNTFAQFNPNYSVGTITGNYSFSYNQTPDQLVEIVSPVYTATSLSYQWESNPTPIFPPNLPGIGSGSSYTFTAPLSQTTYFRRRAWLTANSAVYTYSNVIKIEVVSLNWENLNYIREHDVLKNNVSTDWKTADQLVIGDKLQTTTYLDGLGRPIEKVSKETATPASGSNTWGDMVQFSDYDVYGREPLQYLPYTKTGGTDAGKYKTAPKTDQPSYYTTVYNETSAFSNITFDNSPLNRVVNVKSPGTSWAAGAGNSQLYDLNVANDNVQIFTIGYNTGDIPVDIGVYAAKMLYETTSTDENGHKVVEYTNKSGQLILRKVQINDAPTVAHDGWLCTYNVYDDFGLLRYVLQPKAVQYLDNNVWSFAGTAGQTVLNELCFRYEYDDKGRTILKKAPGAQPLHMLYDSRDRIVFMQDGNQAVKTTPEWTVNIYDELDRVVMTALYVTTKTIAQLQSDIDNATTITTVTIANSGEPITDLVLDTRDPAVTSYKARSSISFVSDAGGDFSSVLNDNFTAEIDATAATPVINTTVATYKDPISSTDLNNPAITTILKYQYYDNYSFAVVKSFDAAFDNNTAYSNSDPNVIPITSSLRTLSYPTGSMVRVLGTNTFLTSTEYYDEKGRHIQTTESNIKNGQDVTTMQYHFDGRLLSVHEKHSTPGSGYSNFSILTKNDFDKIGRIISVEKKYGTNAFKTIASYDYDDVGRLLTKHLDPGYTGSGKNEMESLTYSYNIHGNITGINKDYALKTAGKYNKWSNFFGLYLGYDDNTNFTAQLDGHVAGIMWNTQGDDAQRKYDYSYDNAGRLINALFKQRQKTTDTWDNSKMDFSVTGSAGKITYDFNGNLLDMLQKGVLPGQTTPVDIDKLAYTYTANTNKLQRVTDNTTQTTTNGQLGDFTDGTGGTGTTDYYYDNNGNLVKDLNKNAKDIGGTGNDGIRYNFLDKPELIRIVGKGVIRIVYDAEGNKLQKIFTPVSGSVVTTTYINKFVYKDNDLQYINFEEGRMRAITPVSTTNGYDALIVDGNMPLPAGKEGVYDYFIRDYQKNVRMILTEEIHTGSNKCTMETSRASAEEPIFGQTGTANEVATTRYTKPSGWTANTSASVSRVGNLAATKSGPNSLLKVMAGDIITATTDYYYQNAVVNTTGNNLTTPVLNGLIAAITGSSATSSLVKASTSGITTQLNGDPLFVTATAPQANNPNGNKPKAYLTVLFFDERFNYVDENSSYIRVSVRGDGAAPLLLQDIKAPKNGYAYVYVSNESDEMVYFDNLNVQLNRGRIIEEDHYYAYGLKIAAISSQKLPDSNEGNIDNKNLYNDKELFDDADLDWYNYGFRNYDAQIGRFTQLDPLASRYTFNSPYNYAIDEPIGLVDVGGLGPGQAVSLYNDLVGNGVNASMHVIQAGKNAGKISVSWVDALGRGQVHMFAARAITHVSTNIFTNTFKLVHAVVNSVNATHPKSPNAQRYVGAMKEGFKMTLPMTRPGKVIKGMAETRINDIKNLPTVIKNNDQDGLMEILMPGYREAKAEINLIKSASNGNYQSQGALGMQALTILLGGVEAKGAEGAEVVEAATKATNGKTLLYSFEDDYLSIAEKEGARYFETPDEYYNPGANQKFLDRLIKRGDDVILSRDIDNIIPGSVMEGEVKYLLDNGYKKIGSKLLTKK